MPPASRPCTTARLLPVPLDLPGCFLQLQSYDAGARVRGFLHSAVFEVHACCPRSWRFVPFYGCMTFHCMDGHVLSVPQLMGLRAIPSWPPASWESTSDSTGACALRVGWTQPLEPLGVTGGPQQSPRCLGSSCRPSLAPFLLPWPPVRGHRTRIRKAGLPPAWGAKQCWGLIWGRMFSTHPRGSKVFSNPQCSPWQ